MNKFNKCFLSTRKPRVTLTIHNIEGGGNVTDCNLVLLSPRFVRQDRRVYPLLKALLEGVEIGEKPRINHLYGDFTTVQRNYPIGSVDMIRNHSSDVLV